ncbi:hypothetical protein QN277_026828 [Acacia crassicarpa]|uniref:Uncharacterized protein n=1 Tax=Acacia crassicarpa TaxID=499986 RepID=A0AAE1JD01_9FABA|nr:hypothetical protein QN277_026828 [Acacia crassicarpa]
MVTAIRRRRRGDCTQLIHCIFYVVLGGCQDASAVTITDHRAEKFEAKFFDKVAAFRATLEEISESSLLVHVVDISHPLSEQQIDAVDKVLSELDVSSIPRLMVWNKSVSAMLQLTFILLIFHHLNLNSTMIIRIGYRKKKMRCTTGLTCSLLKLAKL